MSKMIQIRNVPDALHRTLKARAAENGLSLSDYLLRMAEQESQTMSWQEVVAKVRARGEHGGFSGGDVIRELRDEHG
jgi:hypothetical protein